MIKVIHIQNSFEPSKNRIINEYEWKGKTLGELIPPLTSPVISLNQVIVEDLDIIVPDNSEIIIHQKQEVTAIAGWVATTFFSATSLAAASFAATIASYAIAGAVLAAGSMLLSSVMGTQKPNFNSDTSSIETSPTYSWSQATTQPRVGSPIPIVYGEMQTAGSIIQRRIEYVGDDEYLYLQLALCMGEIEDIENGDILINNEPLVNYDDAEYRFTNGTIDQDVMEYFGDVETPNNFTVDLEETPITRQTIGNSNEAIRLFIQFPNGIYYQNNQGGLDEKSVEFKVEYRKIGETEWITQQSYRKGIIGVEYEWRAYYLLSVWSTTQPSKSGIWVKTGRTRSIYNTEYFDTFEFSGAKTSPINREIRIDNLDPDEYEVRVTRITEVSTDPRLVTNAKWSGMGEIIKDDLAYPTVAILGIRIKATGQLSGDVNVLTRVKRKNLTVYNSNGVSQGEVPSSNPAWIFWDILANKQYGYGLSYSEIDFDRIEEWASWCKQPVSNGLDGIEPRAEFNGIFDFEGNIWEALQKVATVGRAAPIIKGTKYSVIVDKPETVTQVFNMGNIVKGSLKVSYIGSENLANEVEVQFINKDKEYTNDTLSVVVPEWFNTDEVSNKTTINQMGTTSSSQAYRAGRYNLNYNKHIKRTVEFEASTEAIECEAGDVIEVSHDVPAWGSSGRIESVISTTSLQLDREIDLIDGNSYKIKVRNKLDEVQELNIIFSGTQTTSTITTYAITISVEDLDIYSIVNTNFDYKKFRITSITRKSDETRKITGIEYNEDLLNDIITILPQDSYSELSFSIVAKSFNITEHLEKRKDGTIIPFVDFAWDYNTSSFPGARFAIYVSKDGGNNYELLKENIQGKNTSIDFLSFEENKKYFFKVSGKLLSKEYSPLQNLDIIEYTFKGKSDKPTSISGITANWSNGKVVFSWDANTDVDFDHYEVSIEGQTYSSNTNRLVVDNLDVGTYYVNVYAVDTSKNKSNVSIYTLVLNKPCTIYMIRDAYLIEKAFIDGVMTIYTSLTEPSSPSIYDIWKVDVSNIYVGEFTFGDAVLKNITWGTTSAISNALYRYYNGEDWILCSAEQTAVVRRMLGQLVSAGIADNEVRVFNIEPYAPYEINDLWIDGLVIKRCISNSSGSFSLSDWITHTEEKVTIATKLENIRS